MYQNLLLFLKFVFNEIRYMKKISVEFSYQIRLLKMDVWFPQDSMTQSNLFKHFLEKWFQTYELLIIFG